jgi:hypothetical protein
MNPRVRIVTSSTFRNPGKEVDTWAEGEAHFLPVGEESNRIQKLFKQKYGFTGRMIDFINRLRGDRADAIIEIKLSSQA